MAKILIIEDEQFIADIYARQLQKEGYEVKHAPDGNMGLQLLQSEVFDLLLLDIMLPGMNGLEILKHFKQASPQSKMVVLLLTNLGQDDVIKTGFDLGAQGYLIKNNYTPQQVVAEVKSALAGSTGTNTPPATQPPTTGQ